ncbi:hypothetical protein PVK06_020745 [Gossypium arboreum]|uniref:DUF4283 domain-containing protein n=1 Tax=Gossypium arboreum TaxID=29729 RepID=A0ABR0PNV4_GOSAR|nr:hypothetical protein PVK06_020745 [Gossypium arboreum]
MATVNTVDEDLANLNIMDEEEEPLMVMGVDDDAEYCYALCLVGRVLTDSVVYFSALKNTLADLQRPLRGVLIMELEDKQILFRLYSEIDLQRVVDRMPWFFNRHLIIFHRLVRAKNQIQFPFGKWCSGCKSTICQLVSSLMGWPVKLGTSLEDFCIMTHHW